MKAIVICLMLLFPFFSFSQTGDPKVDAMLKELKEQNNSKASITFTFDNKTYTDKASFMETDKNTFSIGSSLINDITPNTLINIIVKEKKSGTYTISTGNQNASLVTINNKYYQFGGTVNLTLKGKKIAGTFNGELFEIKKKNSKPDAKSSGKLTGSFNN